VADHDVISKQVIYEGKLITVHRDEIAQGDDTVVREIVDHPDSVAVVVLDPDQRVLLIRQYRPAVGEQMWELPAGLLDHGNEEPEAAARRELAEETGYAADRWQPLIQLHPSPGFTDERAHIFLASGVRDAEETEKDSSESISEVKWLPLDEAVEMVTDGRITNSLAVAGLLAARLRDVGSD
jgi:8-oxo-dGDP phosphatase